MPAIATARADVTARPAQRQGPFTFAVATARDDADVRRLLRDHPLPGRVALSLEREPDSSLAGTIEGDAHQTIVARARATGKVAGLAARVVSAAFVNGEETRLGYLGQLRIADGHHRLRSLIEAGFSYCRELHDRGEVRAYVTSLVADNEASRRLLVERRWRTAPRFDPIAHVDTFVIPVHTLRVAHPEGVRLVRGSSALLVDVVECLQRNLRRYQFAPSWTAQDLKSPHRTRGLSPEDFVVAVADQRVVGCAALWDQRAFKQVVVRGYPPSLRHGRLALNLAFRLLGRPPLPAVGRALECAYLSHVAVDDDREDIFAWLLAAQLRRAREAGIHHVVVGFDQRHPFHSVVGRLCAHRTYRSVIHVVYWLDGEAFVTSLDDRPVQLEVAIL